jgi:hypothetical protein
MVTLSLFLTKLHRSFTLRSHTAEKIVGYHDVQSTFIATRQEPEYAHSALARSDATTRTATIQANAARGAISLYMVK